MTVDPLKPVAPSATKANKIIHAVNVPADYALLGVESGYNPPPANKLRMFILGPIGGGKTTFAAGTPKTLILDFERGSGGVVVSRAHRLSITTYTQLDTVKTKLVKDSKNTNRPYNRVVIDTIGALAEILNTQLVSEINAKCVKGKEICDISNYGTKGAGYSLLRKRTWSIIQELETAGYDWTIIGHITEKTISSRDADLTVQRPVIFDTFGKTISRASDIICNVYPTKKSVPQYKTIQGRRMVVGSTAQTVHILDVTTDFKSLDSAPGKMRNVPDMAKKMELPSASNVSKVGWDVFESGYNEAVTAMKAKLKI